jgi:hypothetical protein
MLIRRGWALEYAKYKFDVEMDETDLLRMLASREVPDPVKLAAGMSTEDVYQALDADAMAFVHDTLRKDAPEGSQARKGHAAKVVAYREGREAVLDKYAPRPAKPEPEGKPAQ